MVKEVSDQGPDGTRMGTTSSDKIGFYGTTPIAQRTSSAMAAQSFAATTAGFGFANATAFDNFQSQVQEITATLKALGLHGGSS